MLQRAHIFLNFGFTESTTEKHEKNQTHALQTRASWRENKCNKIIMKYILAVEEPALAVIYMNVYLDMILDNI